MGWLANRTHNRSVAVTPIKARGMDPDVVKRVCHDSVFTGLAALRGAGAAAATATVRPLRFLYMSGYTAARDATKPPYMFPEYSVMRVRAPYPFSSSSCRKRGQKERKKEKKKTRIAKAHMTGPTQGLKKPLSSENRAKRKTNSSRTRPRTGTTMSRSASRARATSCRGAPCWAARWRRWAGSSACPVWALPR